MADSLRDQLLKSGIVKQLQPARPREDARKNPAPLDRQRQRGVRPNKQSPGHSPQRDKGEIDLAKAYALRAQTDAAERKRSELAAAEQARLRRECKLQIQQLLATGSLNKPDADQPRHFEYGGKIRRVYVDAAQLEALNAGALGVVQQAGRYVLVTREIAEQVRGIDARQLALLIEPGATGIGEDGVPDDLMW
jgi:uncharacterized protein YaiL (DUF2058 family)